MCNSLNIFLKDFGCKGYLVKYFVVRLILMHEKGEGNKSKMEMFILFSHCHIVEVNRGYYKYKINNSLLNCIVCQIYLLNTIIPSSTFCLFQ